jgi:hypothetical protein
MTMLGFCATAVKPPSCGAGGPAESLSRQTRRGGRACPRRSIRSHSRPEPACASWMSFVPWLFPSIWHNRTVSEERQSNPRKRFLLWCFGVGTAIPIVLVILGNTLGPKPDWNPSGLLGTAFGFLTWIIWPTWIFLLDAEHVDQIVVMLLFAAPINGLWYAAVGVLIWHVRLQKRGRP